MKFRKSMFCGSCHQKTFKEWQAADVGESCQSCHMGPAHEKRLTQVPFLSRLHAKRRVRNHSFPHNEINDENLLVKAKVEEGNLQVALLNGGVPHLLPTADNGDPRLYLYVRYLSEAGEEVDEYKEILAPQQDTALVYGKPTEFKYPVPKAVKRIEIEVQYRPAWSKDKQTVRTVELTQIFND